MPATPRVIAFTAAVEAQSSVPDAACVQAGKPEFTVWNHYADATEQFFAGIWSATRGRWSVRYTEHEFCHLLAGRVVLTSEAGERLEGALKYRRPPPYRRAGRSGRNSAHRHPRRGNLRLIRGQTGGVDARNSSFARARPR